jgi:hypothetical protein
MLLSYTGPYNKRVGFYIESDNNALQTFGMPAKTKKTLPAADFKIISTDNKTRRVV